MEPALNLEAPSDPELRRQMTHAQAEAASAQFWLSIIRFVLGGLVAVMSGALAGATLWIFVGAQPGLTYLGPPLLTAGGGEQGSASRPPAAESPVSDSLASAPQVAEALVDSTVPQLPIPDPFDGDLAEPDGPQVDPRVDLEAAPILVPDETMQFSWYEEPPIEEGDQIADLIERQGTRSADDSTSSASSQPLEKTNIFRRLTPGEIDAGLAALDLEALSPKDAAYDGPPAWRRNAVSVAQPFEGPVIALVIDDLGLNRPNTWRTLELPGPLTLALMTYAETLQDFANTARANGHELLVHVPMAPRDPRYDPGPNVLRDDLGREELARRITWGLSRFDGYVGVNNHMGSGFTASIPGMAQLMMELKARGLLYLDSLTVPGAVGAPLADRLGVPFAKRDVFIDNEFEDRESIRRQLQKLERLALRRGRAIGIGHPHDATLEELAIWIPEMQKRGFTLVPISALVLTPSGLAVTPKASNSPG